MSSQNTNRGKDQTQTPEQTLEQALQDERVKMTNRFRYDVLNPILDFTNIAQDFSTSHKEDAFWIIQAYPEIIRMLTLGAYMESLLTCANGGKRVEFLNPDIIDDTLTHWKRGLNY